MSETEKMLLAANEAHRVENVRLIKENEGLKRENGESKEIIKEMTNSINKAIDTLETFPFKDDVIKSAIAILKECL